MKILYISDAKSIHTKRWVNYFSSQGHTVEIVSFREDTGLDFFQRVLDEK